MVAVTTRGRGEEPRDTLQEKEMVGSLEGDTADVVAMTTRGRVEVPSRYSSRMHHKKTLESHGHLEWSQKISPQNPASFSINNGVP